MNNLAIQSFKIKHPVVSSKQLEKPVKVEKEKKPFVSYNLPLIPLCLMSFFSISIGGICADDARKLALKKKLKS